MGTRVYIGRLSYQVRERDIERFFKGYGRIRELLLKNGYGFVVGICCTESVPINMDNEKRFTLTQFRSYRFRIYETNFNVLQEFDDYRDADDAVYELNGKELLGER